MEDYKKDLEAVKAQTREQERRLSKLEDNDQRHEADIKQLYVHQEGTKAYVTQILNKIDQLETKLFNALTQATKHSQEERTGWQEMIKYIIGATIGVIVLYLFQK